MTTLGYEPFLATVDGVDIYGIHGYGSFFSMRITKDKSVYVPQIERAYRFKKHGKSRAVFVELIRRFGEDMGIQKVVAVPSSSKDKISYLQQIYGVVLKRVEDSPPRKYRHQQPVFEDGKVVLDGFVAGMKVLLVDDIVTTGKSILFFRKKLLAAGAKEVVVLGVGLGMGLCRVMPPAEDVENAVAEIRSVSQSEELAEEGVDEFVLDESLVNALAGTDDLMKSLMGGQTLVVDAEQADELRMEAAERGIPTEELLRDVVRMYLDKEF